MEFKSDIQIAQETAMTNISALAAQAGIDEQYLELYGKYKAKIDYKLLKDKADVPDGRFPKSAWRRDFLVRLPCLSKLFLHLRRA